MLFQYASDLHIEFNSSSKDDDPLQYITPSADNLILAGDVCSCNEFERFKMFIERVCKLFKIVIFVAGNHEYYRYTSHSNFYTISEINEKIKSLGVPNFHFLDRTRVEFDNICIAGCTLWSNVNFSIPENIVKIKNISADTYNEMNKACVNFITETVKYCRKYDKKLVVVTHYPPLLQTEKFKAKYKYRELYYNNLYDLIYAGGIHTWIFGHTHLNINCILKDKDDREVNILCNQKGKNKYHTRYYSEKSIVEI